MRAAGIHQILSKPTTESALEAMILKVMGDTYLDAIHHIPHPASNALIDEDVAAGVLKGLGRIQAQANLQELESDMQTLLKSLKLCTSAETLNLQEIHRITGSTGVMGMAKLRNHLIRAEAMELGDPQDLQQWIEATGDLWDDTYAAYNSFVQTDYEA